MKKEGQITAFLLIGLVLLIVIGFLVYMRMFMNMDKAVPKEVASVQSYVKQCVSTAAEQGLYIMGRQGGYIALPETVLLQDYGTMAYGYRDSQNTLRGLPAIKAELENYITTELTMCLSGLQNMGYTVEVGSDVHSYVTFADETVEITSTVPMSVATGKTKAQIDEFTTTVPVRFRKIHGIAGGTADNLVAFPGYVNMTYLGEQDINVYVLTYNDSQVFVFEDLKSSIASEPYKFVYGAEYLG